MKKILFIFSLLIFSFAGLIGLKSVSAQNETREQFSKVFAEYRAKYDEYVPLHEKYLLSKKRYEQYQTLSSKENLQKDLKNMLVKRDEVLVFYYKCLISKMDDSTITVTDSLKADYTSKFETEINWLNDHIATYTSSDSPQVLALKSEEVDIRFTAFQSEVFKNLYYITEGKIKTYEGRYEFLYNDLYSLSEKIKNEQRDAYKLSDSKIETINRWFGEIGLKSQEFNNLMTAAGVQIQKARGKNSRQTYNNALEILNEAMTVFKDRLSKTKEIVTEIKTSEE